MVVAVEDIIQKAETMAEVEEDMVMEVNPEDLLDMEPVGLRLIVTIRHLLVVVEVFVLFNIGFKNLSPNLGKRTMEVWGFPHTHSI